MSAAPRTAAFRPRQPSPIACRCRGRSDPASRAFDLAGRQAFQLPAPGGSLRELSNSFGELTGSTEFVGRLDRELHRGWINHHADAAKLGAVVAAEAEHAEVKPASANKDSLSHACLTSGAQFAFASAVRTYSWRKAKRADVPDGRLSFRRDRQPIELSQYLLGGRGCRRESQGWQLRRRHAWPG